jgi:hypothetical protein
LFRERIEQGWMNFSAGPILVNSLSLLTKGSSATRSVL